MLNIIGVFVSPVAMNDAISQAIFADLSIIFRSFSFPMKNSIVVIQHD